ncbi:MAG: hypothetical protein H0V30_05385 [Chitinophagaceae bacterium]|jgi:hypothetical protein|nr:hypothetical protein [Chitinophagaceae bacterium]
MGHSENRNKQVNNPRQNPNTPNKPDIRDDLDSRKNEEQDFKGDDITQNEKEIKENHLKKKSTGKNS